LHGMDKSEQNFQVSLTKFSNNILVFHNEIL
jgi:hypothetical protein